MSLLRFAVSSSATEEAREARRAQQKAVHERRRSEAERLRFAYPPGRTKRCAGRPTRQQEFEEACVRALNEDQFHSLEKLTSSGAPCRWWRGDPIWVDEERRVAEANAPADVETTLAAADALHAKGLLFGRMTSSEGGEGEEELESDEVPEEEEPQEVTPEGVAAPAAALADAFKAEPQAAPTESGDVPPPAPPKWSKFLALRIVYGSRPPEELG